MTDVRYLQLVEDAELDKRAEEANREEMCDEKGHDLLAFKACVRCGLMFSETGENDG